MLIKRLTGAHQAAAIVCVVLFFKNLRESSDLNVDDMRGIYKGLI